MSKLFLLFIKYNGLKVTGKWYMPNKKGYVSIKQLQKTFDEIRASKEDLDDFQRKIKNNKKGLLEESLDKTQREMKRLHV